MNLNAALLCIDCDEVFTVDQATCNTRCPKCASTVFVPLSAWVPSWSFFEKLQDDDKKDDFAPYRADKAGQGVKIAA